MTATFTEDDLEKAVENANGEVVGTVTVVEDDAAHVEPNPGVVDSIRAALGWRGSHDETVTIHDDAVDEITGETIRLESEEVDDLESEPVDELEDDSRADEQLSDDAVSTDTTDADVTTESPARADDDRDSAAERDPGSGPTTESSDQPRWESADETSSGNAAERAVESDEMDGTDESDTSTVEPSVPESEAPDSPEPADDLESDSGVESVATDPDVDVGGSDTSDFSESDESDDAGAASGPDADVADEIDQGVDLEKAADPTDTEDGVDSSGTESMDLADEIDPGVDLEDATGTGSDPAAAVRPETELDPDLERRSAPVDDARPETVLESEGDVGDASGSSDDRQSAAEIVPGVDVEEAVEPDSEPEIDPDTLAGDTDPGSEVDGIARETVSEDERTAAYLENSADSSETETMDHDRDVRADSFVPAMIDAQRHAIASGQELAKGGLDTQRWLGRSALETPLLVQRQGLEAAQAATGSYLDALSALMGGEAAASATQSRSSDDPAIDLEDEALPAQLSAHLEELHELRADLEDATEPGSERATALLERQIELLEDCWERLDADDGR